MLCVHGEKPMTKDEWTAFMKEADPGGTGRVSAKTFKNMPCWEPPPKPPLPKRHNWDAPSPSDGARARDPTSQR